MIFSVIYLYVLVWPRVICGLAEQET